MKLLGIDFETQCDDAKTTRITEIGATLMEDADLGAGPQWQKVAGYSVLCWEPDYPAQTEEIVELTGITDEMLKASGIPRAEALPGLLAMIEQADVVMAHKEDFDRTVLEQTCQQFGLTVPKREWVCTLNNFPWPKKFTCRKLSHLAYEHGILVDPRTLHRAEADTDLMMELVTQHYDIQKVLAYAREPSIYLRAYVLGPWEGQGGDGGVQAGIAKKMGFAWEKAKGTDSPVFPKAWVMKTKESKAAEIARAAHTCKSPFKVTRINAS